MRLGGAQSEQAPRNIWNIDSCNRYQLTVVQTNGDQLTSSCGAYCQFLTEDGGRMQSPRRCVYICANVSSSQISRSYEHIVFCFKYFEREINARECSHQQGDWLYSGQPGFEPLQGCWTMSCPVINELSQQRTSWSGFDSLQGCWSLSCFLSS